MRIGIFTDTFFPKVDGMSTSTQDLAAELVRQGHGVMVVAPKPKNFKKNAKDFVIPGVKIVWVMSAPGGIYPDLRLGMWSPLLHQELNDFKMEVVHVMAPMPVGMIGVTLAKLNKIPLVMTFHTYFMDPQYLKVIKIEKTAKLIENFGWEGTKLFYKQAEVIIAPSKFVAEDLQQRQFKEPIVTIPNGICLPSKKPDQKILAAKKRELGLAGKRVLITVGRVSVEKNIAGMLRIFQRVTQSEPKAHFLIIGKGPGLAEAQEMVAEMNLEEQVTFMGEVAHEQLLEQGLYGLGEIFVTASMSETQGLSALEAQMFGLPVVAYHSRGLVEVVGKAGKLVRENDEQAMSKAIVGLLHNEAERKKLVAARASNVQKCGIEFTASEIVTVYHKAQKIYANK